MPTAAVPRLRQDLRVTPLQDAEGVEYFDVSDPRTGGVLRLYDFEWLVAEQLTGQHTLEELARWTQQQLGFETSPEDLQVYVQRLQELGLFDALLASQPIVPEAPAPEQKVAAVPAEGPAVPEQVQAAEPIAPVAEVREPEAVSPPVPVPPPQEEAAPVTVMPPPAAAAQPVAPEAEPAAPESQIEEVRSETTEGHTRHALSVSASAPPADDVMGKPLIPVTSMMEGGGPPPPLERRETLLLPALVVPPEAAAAAMATTAQPQTLQDRPTVPLHPVAVEVGATAAGPLDREGISEPPLSRVTLPPASASPIAPAESTQSGQTLVEEEQRPVAVRPVEPSQQSPVLPIDATAEEPPAAEHPATARTGDAEEQAAIRTKPMRAPVTAPEPGRDEEDEVQQGSAGRWFAVLVILVALGLLVYFFFGLKNNAVGVQIIRAQPHQVTRSLSTPAVVRKSAPVVLKMEAGGLLYSVISEGAEVSAGMSLAALQSHTRVQKDITDLRERLNYYQRKRDLARDKGDAGAEREAQAKINEKEERLAAAEDNLKKTQLLASRSGKVVKVIASAGEMITPGSDVVQIADRYLSADMKVSTVEAQGLKVGQAVQLQGGGGPLTARVLSLSPDGDKTTIQFELPDDAMVKPGDELRMIMGRLSNVVELPPSAITEGDTVYVMSQGKASRRKVTVVDHEGPNALVSGLESGDEVIVSNLSVLRDGQSVKAVSGAQTGSL